MRETASMGIAYVRYSCKVGMPTLPLQALGRCRKELVEGVEMMTDREKVIAGLECLTHVNFAIYKTECQERNCPYKDAEQCDSDVMVDAYDLLIAYEGALERLRDAVQEMREDGDLDLRTVLEYIDAIRKDVEDGDG